MWLCILKYDPYYGFKPIQLGETVKVQDNTNGLFVLLGPKGATLGTIDFADLSKHFKQVLP